MPPPGASRSDRFDILLRTWQAARPDLDLSPLEVVTRVLRAARLLQAKLDRIASAYGLSHQGDLEVLTELDLTGPQPPSVLAEDLMLTSGGMTVRLNRLESAGLVERRPNPSDGRGVLVHPTASGRQLVAAALAPLLQAQASIIDMIESDDRHQLTHLLRTLLIALGDIPAFSPDISVRSSQTPSDT